MAAAYLEQLDDIGSERTNLLPRCTPRRCGCGSILTVVVLGLGVIFPLSWQTLPYSEMGLDFNQISGKLDTSRAYERGRHLVGLGHVFIKFPRTIQTIDFAQASELETETSLTSIPVISADGQMVRLECSVWYRLVPDKLGELYTRYATRYASNIAKAARQGITEASSLFDTVDFYQSRARVREAMKLAVAAALVSTAPPHTPPSSIGPHPSTVPPPLPCAQPPGPSCPPTFLPAYPPTLRCRTRAQPPPPCRRTPSHPVAPPLQASYPVQFVDVWLWKCEVPSRLDEAIVNKLVTEQLKRTMLHRQAATLIGEQTQTLVARTAVSEARLLHPNPNPTPTPTPTPNPNPNPNVYQARLLHAARAEAMLEVAVAEASGLATTTGAAALCYRHGYCPPRPSRPLMVPELGSCAHESALGGSGRLDTPRAEDRPLGGQPLPWVPLPWVLEPASSPCRLSMHTSLAFDHLGALAHGMGEMADGLGWGGRQALHWLWWDSARSAALRYIKPAARGATSGAA